MNLYSKKDPMPPDYAAGNKPTKDNRGARGFDFPNSRIGYQRAHRKGWQKRTLGTDQGIAVFGVMGFIVGPVIAALYVALIDIYSREFRSE
jgi:hypothetical protein